MAFDFSGAYSPAVKRAVVTPDVPEAPDPYSAYNPTMPSRMEARSAFYSDAFSPAKRTSPIDNTDYELNDAYKPTGSTTQPERSLTGGATAPDPGAGNNPFAPPGSNASFATPGAGTSQPNIIRDVYAPQLADVGSKLESAYAAPRPGAARQIFGALLSRRNPALGGLVSGETQREQRIQPLQQEYGIIGGQIKATRDQQNQEVENNLKTAQAGYFTNRGNALENPPPKPTLDESAYQDYLGKVNPATGQKYSPSEAAKQVHQDAQDTKPDPIAKTQTPDEQAMGDLMKTINPRTRRPYTAYEARVKLAQGIQDTKPDKSGVGASEHDMEPVMAYDKAGKAHIVPKSEATAPGSGYSNIIKATDKDLNDANTHAVVLNDMQSKLNDVVNSRKALDQGPDQRAIISKVLSHSEPGMINDSLNAFALHNATQQTKDYIQKVLSLKESALGLPKEITGGSRTSEIQGNALFQTLPSGASVDSSYALDQAKTFQGNIDRLRERVPSVRGMTALPPHPALSGGGSTGGGAKLSRPKPNVVVEQ